VCPGCDDEGQYGHARRADREYRERGESVSIRVHPSSSGHLPVISRADKSRIEGKQRLPHAVAPALWKWEPALITALLFVASKMSALDHARYVLAKARRMA